MRACACVVAEPTLLILLTLFTVLVGAKELFMLGHVSDTISILTSFAIVCGFLYSFQADDEYDCIYTTISLSHQKQ